MLDHLFPGFLTKKITDRQKSEQIEEEQKRRYLSEPASSIEIKLRDETCPR